MGSKWMGGEIMAINPFATESAATLTPDQSTGVLPVASPDLNPAALRVAELERQAAEEKVPGITAAPIASAVKSATDIQTAFDAADDRQKALEFEKTLDAGWPLAKQAWIAAGSPPELNPDNFATGDPKIDGGPNGTLVNFYKGLTGYKDTNEVEAGRNAAADAAKNGTPSDAAAALSGKDAKKGELAITAAEKTAGLTEKTTQAEADRTSRETIAKGHDTARVTAAHVAHALDIATDPAKVEALKVLKDRLDTQQQKLDDLDQNPPTILKQREWQADHDKVMQEIANINAAIPNVVKTLKTRPAIATADSITNTPPPATPSKVRKVYNPTTGKLE